MDFQLLEAGLKSVPEQLKWLETMVLEHQVSRRPGIELIPPPPHPPRVFHSHNLALPFGPRAFAQLFACSVATGKLISQGSAQTSLPH